MHALQGRLRSLALLSLPSLQSSHPTRASPSQSGRACRNGSRTAGWQHGQLETRTRRNDRCGRRRYVRRRVASLKGGGGGGGGGLRAKCGGMGSAPGCWRPRPTSGRGPRHRRRFSVAQLSFVLPPSGVGGCGRTVPTAYGELLRDYDGAHARYDARANYLNGTSPQKTTAEWEILPLLGLQNRILLCLSRCVIPRLKSSAN